MVVQSWRKLSLEWRLLIAELCAMFWALSLFLALDVSRYWAAVLAGCGFLALGVYGLILEFQEGMGWRALATYGFLLHLFVATLPLLGIRLLSSRADLSETTLFGVPIEAFHHGSEAIYLALIALTVADGFRRKSLF